MTSKEELEKKYTDKFDLVLMEKPDKFGISYSKNVDREVKNFIFIDVVKAVLKSVKRAMDTVDSNDQLLDEEQLNKVAKEKWGIDLV